MAGTVTLVSGPTIEEGGGGGVSCVFSVAMITSTTSNGEPIDLTDYFSYAYGGAILGVDAHADATWEYKIVTGGRAVAISSTNVLVYCSHGAGTDNPNLHADAEDLSSVGALMIKVYGKALIPTSWA